MATANIDTLQQAINNLTSTIQGHGAGSGGASQGMVQGVAEAAVTSTALGSSLGNKLNGDLDTLTNALVSGVEKLEKSLKGVTTKLGKAFSDFSMSFLTNMGIQDLTKYGSGGTSGTEDREKEKGKRALEGFNSWLNKAALTITGFVAAGLAGTVEGYKLTTAFSRLTYALADAMKGPIDFFTQLINKVAATFRELNSIPMARNFMAVGGSLVMLTWAVKGLVFVFTPLVSAFGALAAAMGISTLALLGYAGIIAAAIIAAPYIYNAAYKAGADSHKWLSETVDSIQDKMYEKFGIQGGPYNHAKERYDATKAAGYDNWAEAKEAQEKDAYLHKFILDKDMNSPEEKVKGKAARDAYEKGTWREYDAAHSDSKEDKKDDHLHPTYSVSFTALTSLWENMNKMVAERPGLETTNGLLDDIKKILQNMGVMGPDAAKPQGALKPG